VSGGEATALVIVISIGVAFAWGFAAGYARRRRDAG
jgi:hypothetical protein